MVTPVDDQNALAVALIESSAAAVIATGMGGTVLLWNHGAQVLFGVEPAHAIGNPLLDVMAAVDPDSYEQYASALEQVKETGAATVSGVRSRTGSLGKTANFRLVREPTSGQRLIAIEIPSLEQSNLNESTGDLVLRLRKAKEEAEAANRELEAFSYSVAHDLRAPLRAIEGFSRVLLKDYESAVPSNARHYLQRVHRSALSMAELIDDLLLLARVTRNELRLDEVDLAALASEEIMRLRETQPDRNVEFQASSARVWGDEGLLRVLMDNLISNAWKFSSRCQLARIEFGKTMQDGELVFYVHDNGAGFEMIYMDKLFIPFQRLHRQDEFAGTGIGLATSARIVHRHGGRIWADAAVNEGATFFFTIPGETERLTVER